MRKRFGVLLTVIIIALVAYLLREINFSEVYNLLTEIKLVYFVLAIIACLCSFLLQNLRLKISLSKFVKVKYWFLFKVLLAGVFVNTVTPGSSVGGEPVKAYFLSKQYNAPKSKFLGVIIADKLFNLIILSLLVLFSILFVLLFVNIPSDLKLIFELILIIFTGAFITVLFSVRRKKKNSLIKLLTFLFKFKFVKEYFHTLVEFERYINAKLSNIIFGFKKAVTNKRQFMLLITLAIIIWIFNFLISYFLFQSFDARISFFSIIIVVTLGHLIGDLSPVPGGIGLIESTMVVLYISMGIAPPLAAIVALLSRLILYIFGLGFGGLSLSYLNMKLK